jgi:hypothetical protein
MDMPTEEITTEAVRKSTISESSTLRLTTNKYSEDAKVNKQRKKKAHKRRLRASHTNG